jgi:hypothetical protein
MELHAFKCDRCGRQVNATFNGEHFLPPKSWHKLYCDHRAVTIDVIICASCLDKIFKNSTSEVRNLLFKADFDDANE